MNTPVLVLFVGLLCYASAASLTSQKTLTTNPQPVEFQKGATPCVTPKQWEGRFSEWDHNKDANNRYKISFDGVKRRKYVEEELKSMIPGRRLMKYLILFDERVEYQIDPSYNQCKKIPIGPWRNFSIPPDATFEDAYTIGGAGNSINVTEWSDRKPSRSYETWIGGYTEANCWPVFEIFTMKNQTIDIDMTTRFFDITEGIKNMSVFDVPAICNQAILANTPITSHTWLWERFDSWIPSWAKDFIGWQRIDHVTATPVKPRIPRPTKNLGLDTNKPMKTIERFYRKF